MLFSKYLVHEKCQDCDTSMCLHVTEILGIKSNKQLLLVQSFIKHLIGYFSKIGRI